MNSNNQDQPYPNDNNVNDVEDECPAHLILVPQVPPSVPLPKIVHLKKPIVTVGRQKNEPDPVDIFLDSTRVPRMISRLHAKFLQTSETDNQGRHLWKLVDNNSLNGVFVNDVKVAEKVLEDGDRIIFGGGGKLALGVTKAQTDSEFVFVFKLRKTNPFKRKNGEDKSSPSQDIGNNNHSQHEAINNENGTKRQKTLSSDEIDLEKMKILEELRLKNQALEEQAQRLKELESKLNSNITKYEEAERDYQTKELLLSKQTASFHDQLEKIQAKFEDEKNRFEEQKKKIMEDTEKQHRELADSKKQLEVALEEKQKKLTEVQNQAIISEDLEEELTCIICHDLIKCAMTIECSHSFCSSCIRSWLERQKNCPVCREPITKAPVRSRTVDNAILKIVAKRGEQQKREWEAVVSAESKRIDEEVVLKKLQELIGAAKAKNLKFLNIGDGWNNDEKKVFMDGVSRYTGRARVLYCETTGLTESFINVASANQLRTAAQNVGVLHSPHAMVPIPELKHKLLSFIQGTSAQQPIVIE